MISCSQEEHQLGREVTHQYNVLLVWDIGDKHIDGKCIVRQNEKHGPERWLPPRKWQRPVMPIKAKSYSESFQLISYTLKQKVSFETRILCLRILDYKSFGKEIQSARSIVR